MPARFGFVRRRRPEEPLGLRTPVWRAVNGFRVGALVYAMVLVLATGAATHTPGWPSSPSR